MSKRKARREVEQLRASAAPVSVLPFALLAFFSGLAALVYQVLWVRQLGIVVGVDIYAVTAGVSAFFAGLALGGLFFGRRADRAQHPLFAYCLLELAIALGGIVATLAFAHTASPFLALQLRIGPFAWLLVFVLIGVPAFLIGGTLPFLFRAWAPESHIAAGGGILYALNTAGGIAGALFAPFLLIPTFGIRGASYFAAAMNVCVAVAALILNRRVSPLPEQVQLPSNPALESKSRTALVLYSVAGGIALGYEVIWSQAIVPFMSTRTFAFAFVLATYLAGLMLGSATYSRIADRLKDPWTNFALLISSAGLLALALVAGLGHWLLILQTQAEALVLSATGSILAGMCARFAVAAASVVFLPTLPLGAAFPVILKLAVGPQKIGKDVGYVLAFNTFGGIAGTLITGFVLVPAIGLMRSLAVLAVCACAVAVFAVLRGLPHHTFARYAVFSLGALAALVLLLVPPDRLAQTLTVARGGGEVVFYRETAAGTVAVLQEPKNKGDFRRLYIQGVSNSGDAMPSLRYMRLQALLPLLITEQEPKSALVIGYGTGITSGALLPLPSLDKRVCVELLSGVVDASSLFHGNFSAAEDPRLQIRLGDGRRELLRSSDRYDLITLEPPPPSASGVANLYSTNFYQLAATRLQPGGMLAQWLPLGAQNIDDSRAIVRSFLDVFPQATLWTTELHEMLLVGSFQPIVLDVDRISQRFHQPPVESALREVGINSPAALISTWVTDRNGLQRFAADVAPVTDDRPSIEYTTWVRPGEVARVLPELLSLRTAPPLRGASDDFQVSLAAEQERLGDFYEAALAAYRGERELWARSIHRVLATDGQNPYYTWTLSGSR